MENRTVFDTVPRSCARMQTLEPIRKTANAGIPEIARLGLPKLA